MEFLVSHGYTKYIQTYYGRWKWKGIDSDLDWKLILMKGIQFHQKESILYLIQVKKDWDLNVLIEAFKKSALEFKNVEMSSIFLDRISPNSLKFTLMFQTLMELSQREEWNVLESFMKQEFILNSLHSSKENQELWNQLLQSFPIDLIHSLLLYTPFLIKSTFLQKKICLVYLVGKGNVELMTRFLRFWTRNGEIQELKSKFHLEFLLENACELIQMDIVTFLIHSQDFSSLIGGSEAVDRLFHSYSSCLALKSMRGFQEF